MEKNKLLKGAGVALIVIGALIAVVALMCFALGDMIAEIVGAEIGGDIAIKTVVALMGVVLLIDAAAYIAAGVVGVKQKSVKACFVVAIILIVVSGLSAITDLTSGQWYSAILVLVAPVIYLVGAIQLKKASETVVVEQVENVPNDENK